MSIKVARLSYGFTLIEIADRFDPNGWVNLNLESPALFY